jgi:hypothetical protein
LFGQLEQMWQSVKHIVCKLVQKGFCKHMLFELDDNQMLLVTFECATSADVFMQVGKAPSKYFDSG